MSKIEALNDRVIVSRSEVEDVTKSGLFIPETGKEKPQEGEVVAVGTCKLIDGKAADFFVKIGDRVLMPKYGGTDVKINGEQYQLIREDDILAIVG